MEALDSLEVWPESITELSNVAVIITGYGVSVEEHQTLITQKYLHSGLDRKLGVLRLAEIDCQGADLC